MAQNIPGSIVVGQTIDSTVYNKQGQAAEGGASFSEWPGEKGDSTFRYTPTTITNGSATVPLSVSFGAFSFSDSVPVAGGDSFGYYWPHGNTNPAFGAYWAGFGTDGSDDSSANVESIATGQSIHCEFDVEVY